MERCYENLDILPQVIPEQLNYIHLDTYYV